MRIASMRLEGWSSMVESYSMAKWCVPSHPFHLEFGIGSAFCLDECYAAVHLVAHVETVVWHAFDTMNLLHVERIYS